MPPPTDPLLVLRTITTLLTTTSEASLPSQIPIIARQLYASPVLNAAVSLSSSGGRESEDAMVLVNKFKTRVSALLQSRVNQARWCGVVIVKCTVESSFEALAAWGGLWAKALVGLVTRPEPTTTTVMVIRTLTRIFTALSTDKPTMTREIVTPHLPAFFGGLISALGSEDSRVTAAAMEALRDVITAHPVTFRPFSTKTKGAVLNRLALVGGEHEKTAREVFVKLHLCASNNSKRASGQEGGKGNAVAGEWRDLFEAVLKEVHSTLDRVYKPVVEDYDYRHSSGKNVTLGIEPAEEDIASQVARLMLLLRLIGSFFTTPTTAQPQIPLAQLIDATSRIFAITIASATPNPAVEKGHRETLFSLLPSIHTAALNLLDTIALRLQGLLLPFVPALLEQTAYVHAEISWSADIRVAVYTLTNTLLAFSGPALAKATIDALHPVFSVCCDDLLPPPPPPPPPPTKKQKQTAHADLLMAASTPRDIFSPPALASAASTLLATSLAKMQPQLLRAEVRAKMERTAVITGNKEALLAAVLFPRVAARCGVLPHLVRGGVGLVEEAVVRPRMPVVWTGPSRKEVRRQIEEEKEAREEEEMREVEPDVEEMEVEAVAVVKQIEQEHHGNKRLRMEEQPQPPPQPQPVRTAASSFFSRLLPPSTTAATSTNVSPEKLYPSLVPSGDVAYPTLDDKVVMQTTTSTSIHPTISPLKPFGDGSQLQLRKEVEETAGSGSDSEMEEMPEIVLGDSDDTDDDE
ncbi:rRNA processing/ribosome biogenesis-domain-containing protein [Trichophaea hybrida]|nr:rRNA processing/ribosome biogenesis-domain-containing protein [Trichophaea hybrida]